MALVQLKRRLLHNQCLRIRRFAVGRTDSWRALLDLLHVLLEHLGDQPALPLIVQSFGTLLVNNVDVFVIVLTRHCLVRLLFIKLRKFFLLEDVLIRTDTSRSIVDMLQGQVEQEKKFHR